MQVEAGSSRRSSISELPSSPLTSTTASGSKEEVPHESEESLPRRKQPKPSSSKSEYTTTNFLTPSLKHTHTHTSPRAVAYQIKKEEAGCRESCWNL